MLKKQWKIKKQRKIKIEPQKRGSVRREEILLKARYGIRLNVRGGVGLNQDMRRLIHESLVCIERSANTERANISRLVLTDLGRTKVTDMGFDPDEPRPEPDKQRFLVDGDMIDAKKTRRVLMAHGREHVHLMRPAKVGDDAVYNGDIPVKYITYGWNKNDIVYHFWDEIKSAMTPQPLIPVGYLRETGRGLTLRHSHILQVSGEPKNISIEPEIWVELKQTLTSICNVRFIYRIEFRPSESSSAWRAIPTLYVLCESGKDLLIAKMIFGEGVQFIGHHQTK